MINDIEVLKLKPLAELQAMYAQVLGTKPHHMKKAESLAVDILKARPQIATQTVEIEQPKPAKKEAPAWCTESEVRDALAQYIARGAVLTFADDCWQIKYGVASDSGHMSMPLKVIVRKVTTLLNSRLPAVDTTDGTVLL